MHYQEANPRGAEIVFALCFEPWIFDVPLRVSILETEGRRQSFNNLSHHLLVVLDLGVVFRTELGVNQFLDPGELKENVVFNEAACELRRLFIGWSSHWDEGRLVNGDWSV